MVVSGPRCGLHEDLPILVLSAQQEVARVITPESSRGTAAQTSKESYAPT
jgi:hypothetical protein